MRHQLALRPQAMRQPRRSIGDKAFKLSGKVIPSFVCDAHPSTPALPCFEIVDLYVEFTADAYGRNRGSWIRKYSNEGANGLKLRRVDVGGFQQSGVAEMKIVIQILVRVCAADLHHTKGTQHVNHFGESLCTIM
jgi:hypothetical protein